jgi:1-acyl-sn-glycerol-3-phosphate acyltransferase
MIVGMGRSLSLLTVLEVARITVPTAIEAALGRSDRAAADRRLARFGRVVVERARMRLTVDGTDNVPTGRAFIYMSNHQSHLDIPVLYATTPARSLRMVGKAELFRIPLFGAAMRAADFVEVDRSNRAQAIASLARAARQIADGISVWIAPEGHRSPDGALQPLKKGGFHLAHDTATPIVPVAISGTNAILPPGALSMRAGQPVHVVYGAPIATADRPIAEVMSEVDGFLHAHVQAPTPAS